MLLQADPLGTNESANILADLTNSATLMASRRAGSARSGSDYADELSPEERADALHAAGSSGGATAPPAPPVRV